MTGEALLTDPFAVGDVATPAVLTGVLGYAIGNCAGVGMALHPPDGSRLAKNVVAAGTERAHMGEIERGEVTATIVTALKIAQALGMTLAGPFSGLERGQQPHRQRGYPLPCSRGRRTPPSSACRPVPTRSLC